MFTESPLEAFNISSLLKNSQNIIEHTHESIEHIRVDKLLRKSECKELYPHNYGSDGEQFYQLIVLFRSRHFAEKLVTLCNFDIPLAIKLGTICHGNIYLLKRLCLLFSNDIQKALNFLRHFESYQSTLSPFFLASQFLSRFNDNLTTATTFLSKYSNNVTLSERAVLELSSKLVDSSTFETALACCDYDCDAAINFVDLTGIKHLELLYDSEKHLRNAKEFHSRCDDQGPTVSFVYSKGNCVCGVVQSSWNSPISESENVSDSTAFLLRLTPRPQRFNIRDDEVGRALLCNKSFGPCFGSRSDFGVGFVSTDQSYPKGLFAWANTNGSYNLPADEFLVPTNGVTCKVDRLIVCKCHTENDWNVDN